MVKLGGVLCIERRFCWESITWSSLILPPSLTVGQVGVVAEGEQQVTGQESRPAQTAEAPAAATKDNLQEERPLLSPCLNKVAFQIFQHTSSPGYRSKYETR